MDLITQKLVEQYLEDDKTNYWLDKFSTPTDEEYTCQKWLRESAAKRYIFNIMYGDLLKGIDGQRVLDVGGGVTAFSSVLASRHDYVLCELLAHDEKERVSNLSDAMGREFIKVQDWWTLEDKNYDLLIANDLFPNADQRLELFLEKFLPRCVKARLLLTWYDVPRHYMVRRVDADEIMTILAWDGFQVRGVLQKYISSIVNADLSIFDQENKSVYPNGRQTCIVEFQGDLG
tara:strand:- start:1071 stop:1766 length:696 start_codon:yes stop_codon:yes gene_type:complete